MIFSLGEASREISFPTDRTLDVFCFFKVSHSIACPTSLWFEAICTSLKMKHSVLILEETCEKLPEWNSGNRWQCGDDWCWLSPRSLSVIFKKYSHHPMSFQEFKNFLKSSK